MKPIKLEIMLSHGGIKSGCSLTLDPLYVEAVGLEKIAADATAVARKKLDAALEAKRRDEITESMRMRLR